MAIASEDSAQRVVESASSDDESDEDEKEESEEDAEEEEEEEELGEADHSSESGTDESEVGRASSHSGGSDNDGESEDDEVSDTDQEAEPAPADGGAKPASPGVTRSVFLKRITAKSSTQPNERTDCKVPSKFPQKPMIELQVSSNIWYQAYVFKESANEVKVRFPGFGRAKTDKIEWLKKSSCRIWTGSYKASDWKHLGKGAWEPRSKPVDSRQQAARSGSAGAVGSAGRAKGRLKRFRDENTASATPELTSQAGDGSDNELVGKDCEDQSPTSKGKKAQGRKGRAGEDHEAVGHAAAVQRKPKKLSGAGLEEEVVSPRPIHSSGLRGAADKGAPQLLQAQRQPGLGQQRNGGQQQPVGDEHHSEGEHYWSAHSPNVAESPGIFADQNSSRSSLDLAGGNNLQVHDPDYDPLRKWFEVHFQKLQAAGKLSSLPFGMCESGVLPDGFVLDAAEGIVAAAGVCSRVEASLSCALKPSSGALPKPAGPTPTPAGLSAPRGSESIHHHHKKRTREPVEQHDCNHIDGGKAGVTKRPVKLMVKQVPPQPVAPGPAASVEDMPVSGSGSALLGPPSGFWVGRDAAAGQGQGLLSPPKVKESKESKEVKEGKLGQHASLQHPQHSSLQSRAPQAQTSAVNASAAVAAVAVSAVAAPAPAAAAVPPVAHVAKDVSKAVGLDDFAAGGQKAPCTLQHKAVSKNPSKDRLGRRIVMSDSSDDDEDQLSPRPAAAAAAAAAPPAAAAAAAVAAQPAAGSAQPSAAAALAAVPAAAAAAAAKPVAGPAHANPGSTNALVAATPAGTASVREESATGSRPANSMRVATGANKESTVGSVTPPTVPASSTGQQRGQAVEGSRPGGGADQVHAKGFQAGESGCARGSESGGVAGEGPRARGSGPGLSRPGSPVAGSSGFRSGQQQGSGPSRSEPDRSKAAPVLATDDDIVF